MSHMTSETAPPEPQTHCQSVSCPCVWTALVSASSDDVRLPTSTDQEVLHVLFACLQASKQFAIGDE
eukprot:1431779-Amphidinium_carterae.1